MEGLQQRSPTSTCQHPVIGQYVQLITAHPPWARHPPGGNRPIRSRHNWPVADCSTLLRDAHSLRHQSAVDYRSYLPRSPHGRTSQSAISAINHDVQSLAEVINSPDIFDGSTVTTDDYEVPIDYVVKRQGRYTYVFAVAMRNGSTRGLFNLRGLPPGATATVIGEGRSFDINDGVFTDEFGPYDVRLYRIERR